MKAISFSYGTELNDGSYEPGKSIAFIVHKPVQREIFAADFRDRVVHHLIINKLNPLFEKKLLKTVMLVVLEKVHITASVEPINTFASVLKITQKIVMYLN
ncbi:MAG: hypothetical protein ACJAUJ_000904 [Salibacteraceae bacterium]|jgi:hypothetical protein